MADLAVVCTDGSELAERAAAAGLAVLRTELDVVVVTVIEEADPSLVTGTGFAGGTVSPEEYDQLNVAREAEGANAVEQLAGRLGRGAVRTEVLHGDPARAVCDYAAQASASVIILGTRGRGGVKRALLGSVSDHVLRNAPCPVLVTGDDGSD